MHTHHHYHHPEFHLTPQLQSIQAVQDIVTIQVPTTVISHPRTVQAYLQNTELPALMHRIPHQVLMDQALCLEIFLHLI